MNGGIEIRGLQQVLARNRRILSKFPGEQAKIMARIANITRAESVSNAPISPTKGQYEGEVSARHAQKKANSTGQQARVRFKSRQDSFNPGGLQRSIKTSHSAQKAVIFVPSNSEAGKYADYIHNGTYKLGIGSRAKAAAGHDVGPKFIERAIDKLRPKYLMIISDTIAKIVKG